ncbi:hypothetical protein HK104_010584 [Borealophlyctis nickersoniae]|nr:hypothetical protein HK104_010584 [Borealophlyctis nickersoniae]
MSEVDGTATKISDLAKESRKGEGHSTIPAIPLTLLAPLLVIIALIGVVVPNSIILNQASQSSTDYLSDKYLKLLLDDNETFVQKVYVMKEEFRLDTLSCATGRWASGYNNSFPPNVTTVNVTGIQVLKNPMGSGSLLFVGDYNMRGYGRAYLLNNITRMPVNPSAPDIPIMPADISKDQYLAMQLGVPGVEPRREPYFTGNDICFYDQVQIVSMFNTKNFTVIATSNTILTDVGGTMVNGAFAYNVATLDNTTLAIKDSLYRRFQSFQAAASANVSSYEDVIEGKTWIINLALANMSSYTDTDSLLLVVALPHSEIYGVIEAARKRSMDVAIGISVGMAIFVSGVYLAVVIPLLKLAKAMGILTKLDFHSLENSNILDARSAIWELRKVQSTFSTMVKAFAGGIKKNREMVARTVAVASKASS